MNTPIQTSAKAQAHLLSFSCSVIIFNPVDLGQLPLELQTLQVALEPLAVRKILEQEQQPQDGQGCQARVEHQLYHPSTNISNARGIRTKPRGHNGVANTTIPTTTPMMFKMNVARFILPHPLRIVLRTSISISETKILDRMRVQINHPRKPNQVVAHQIRDALLWKSV